jgi:hypothetical protein
MNEPNDDDADFPEGSLPWKARQVVRSDNMTLVLLDPDEYLADAMYIARRKAGAPALRNLWAFDVRGVKLWEAELPENHDYYFEIKSATPPRASSFSGFTCDIDEKDGTIVSKEFHK